MNDTFWVYKVCLVYADHMESLPTRYESQQQARNIGKRMKRENKEITSYWVKKVFNQ